MKKVPNIRPTKKTVDSYDVSNSYPASNEKGESKDIAIHGVNDSRRDKDEGKGGENQTSSTAPQIANADVVRSQQPAQSKSLKARNTKTQKNSEKYPNLQKNRKNQKNQKNQEKSTVPFTATTSATPPVSNATTTSTRSTNPVVVTKKPKEAFYPFRFDAKVPRVSDNQTTEENNDCDFRFLKSEAKNWYGKPAANSKSNQTKRTFKNKSQRGNYFDYLNSLEENDHTIKLDVKNQCGISTKSMEKILDLYFFNKKDEAIQEFGNLLKIFESGDYLNLGDVNEAKSFKFLKLLKKIKDRMITAVASIFIANARFIKNKVHLRGAKSFYIRFVVSQLDKMYNARDFITPTEVIEKVYSLLRETKFEEDQTGKFFSLEKGANYSA